jgi:hypothetical protein
MTSVLSKSERDILQFLAFRKSACWNAIKHHFNQKGLDLTGCASILALRSKGLIAEGRANLYYPHKPDHQVLLYWSISEAGMQAILADPSIWPPGIRWEANHG